MGIENKQIAWELTAIDRSSAVFGNVEAGMKSLEGTFTKLAGVLGVGLSAGAFVSFIEGGIEAEASLHKLALQTGITVETLSALRPIAKQAGTDLDTVAGMVNKLEKNMLTFAQSGGGKAADAFKQLGYSQAQVREGLQNIDVFLPEFAKRLVETGVGGEQAGLAMQLMAKGGAAALPFLQQLAENGTLLAKVTTEQAKAAHEFEVSMVKLKSGSGELAISLANQMLPALNAITDAMVDAKKEGGALAAIWAGLKAMTVGTEKFQAEKDLFDQTSKMLALEATLGRLRQTGYKEETFAVVMTKAKLATVKDEIARSRARIDLLQHEQDLKDKAHETSPKTPLPDLAVQVPGMSEHDLQVYAHAVQAVRELDAAEKDRAKTEADADAAFVKAMHEFNQYTEGPENRIKQQEQAYRDALSAAEDYIDTLRKVQATDLEGMGAGGLERSRAAGRAQIENKYTEQLRAINRARVSSEFAGTFDEFAQKKYDDELELIRRFKTTALSEYDAYYAERLKKEADWSVGASEAMKNYIDESRNAAKQTEDLFRRSFRTIEDAELALLKRQKVNFKSFANSIIDDLARIELKKINAFAIGSLGGDSGIFGAIGKMLGFGTAGMSNGEFGAPVVGGRAFATGGSFIVGGSGGTDSQSVRFRATPGERVTVQTPAQQAGGSGSIPNIVFNVQQVGGPPMQMKQSGPPSMTNGEVTFGLLLDVLGSNKSARDAMAGVLRG